MLEATPKDVFGLLGLQATVEEAERLLGGLPVEAHHRLLVDEGRHLFREGLELLLAAQAEDEEGRALSADGPGNRAPLLRGDERAELGVSSTEK